MHQAQSRFRRIEGWLEALVIIAALSTIPLTYLQARGHTGWEITAVDWSIWAIFTLEFLVLMRFAANRQEYVRGQWLALFIIVVSFPLLPDLLALTRLLRLVRLVRLLRLLRLATVTAKGVRALERILGRQGVLFVGAASIILILAGGAALALLEPESTGGNVGVGIWWAIVTSTTVGYGDIAPETVPGRILGVILMLLGIGIVGTLAASIAAFFVDSDDEAEVDQLRARLGQIEDIQERLERIEATQQRIERLLIENRQRTHSTDR